MVVIKNDDDVPLPPKQKNGDALKFHRDFPPPILHLETFTRGIFCLLSIEEKILPVGFPFAG